MTNLDSFELYRPESAVEAQAIRALLETSGIACSVVSFTDTAYPGIGDQGRGWGRIMVQQQDAARAEQLVAEYIDSEPVDEQASGDD